MASPPVTFDMQSASTGAAGRLIASGHLDDACLTRAFRYVTWDAPRRRPPGLHRNRAAVRRPARGAGRAGAARPLDADRRARHADDNRVRGPRRPAHAAVDRARGLL